MANEQEKEAAGRAAAKLVRDGDIVGLGTKADGSPFVTDNGNQILDCSFGKIADPPALARELSGTPGVVEHGLFIGLAKLAIVGRGNSVEEIRPQLARRLAQTKRDRTKRPSRKRQTKSRKP